MHILGFDCYGHDAAAAIVRDGRLLGLVEEERFVQKKHVADFPIHAIRWCCETAGIDLGLQRVQTRGPPRPHRRIAAAKRADGHFHASTVVEDEEPSACAPGARRWLSWTM